MIKNYRWLLEDIRFWIVLFFLLRLVGITNPPLEVAHNWRQTTVTMVARNFVEVDENILYPRIDIAGEKSGITGMEFPLLNYLIYLISGIFGYDHWYGRLINLIISSLGLFYFFKLLKRYFSKQVAFNATIILLFSIWFSYSRKIMPDTFAMSFIISGIYFASCYLEKNNIKVFNYNLWLAVILIGLGVLCKLPSGFLLVLLIPILFQKSVLRAKKWDVVIFISIGLMPAIIWYFFWVPHLIEKYEFQHFFMGKGIKDGSYELMENLNLTLKKFYENALKFVGFATFILGLFYAIKFRNTKVLWTLVLSFSSFLLIMMKAGSTFSEHTYYIIPFVPVMAMVAGYGIDQLNSKKWTLLLLLVIGFEGIINQQHDFQIKTNDFALLNLESDLDQFSEKDELILINSGSYPTPMYFAHRKGWVLPNEEITELSISNLQPKGLQYVVIMKKRFGEDKSLNLNMVFESEHYKIYQL